jgi:hypothetical protein
MCTPLSALSGPHILWSIQDGVRKTVFDTNSGKWAFPQTHTVRGTARGRGHVAASRTIFGMWGSCHEGSEGRDISGTLLFLTKTKDGNHGNAQLWRSYSTIFFWVGPGVI